jgi:GMP synthase (glutamine-hydrolysing)
LRDQEVLVLEHTAGAGVSAFAEVLDGRAARLPWRRADVPGGDPLPDDLDAVAGLVVMGGHMSAVDPSAHAWMGAELELLRGAVAAEVPVLGVCLGAQLLGAALGGTVKERAVPRMRTVPLQRTDAGREHPVTVGWPDGARALFVHEDHVTTLPDRAAVLLEPPEDEAADEGGADAWTLGSATAVQFHPEVTAEQLSRWLDGGQLDAMLARSATDPEALRTEAQRRDRVATGLGRALVGRFLDGPVRERVSRQRPPG